MTGRISLKGMVFHSFHGVHKFEREKGNNFRIDLTFETDIKRAAESDHLEDTLDYEEVYQVVSEVMEVSVNLLEHLAYKISSRLLETFPRAHSLEITVAKLSPPLNGRCEESSVTLTLHR